MDVLLVLVVLAVAVLLIAGPLRAGPGAGQEAAESAERAELEAAKEAKYREIRDAELDFRTGKLSRADWRRLDSALRAEAVELLRRLDALDESVSKDSSRLDSASEK
jgi:hypothetical protein